MIVTRGGHGFDVDDDDLSGDWHFWERFASGRWEPEILDRMPELLADGGTFVDVGAWIGPHLLWALACGADHCVGFEPDPTAYAVLERNVSWPITVAQVAIAAHTGTTTIEDAGDSTSRTGCGGVEVPCFTFADATKDIDHISLVKIDIEGAEVEVVPQANDDLLALGCPVFLSLHPWAPFDIPDGWLVEPLARHEVLLWPR